MEWRKFLLKLVFGIIVFALQNVYLSTFFKIEWSVVTAIACYDVKKTSSQVVFVNFAKFFRKLLFRTPSGNSCCDFWKNLLFLTLNVYRGIVISCSSLRKLESLISHKETNSSSDLPHSQWPKITLTLCLRLLWFKRNHFWWGIIFNFSTYSIKIVSPFFQMSVLNQTSIISPWPNQRKDSKQRLSTNRSITF